MQDLVLESIKTTFPDVKMELSKLMGEGYEIHSVSYKSVAFTNHEFVDITLKKESILWSIRQSLVHNDGFSPLEQHHMSV